ncbi:hypothetical protein [Streptomyces sp. MI02-7b]|uniref:hypothetical protein n=1 Tax=Streptomyces sp. MI02-7b TaxID=462941 RepID=UPI0029C9C71F|nr:hypothetical protein [Streptomyces sp. MI02-7b]
MEHGRKHGKPLMSEIILVSSHRPWAPIPRTVGWDELGDGSVFNAINKEGKNPDDVWKSAHSVRQEYAKSIAYTVSSLVSWVERYGNDNTVLVFLGDHQPTTMVSGKNPSHDVPIAIVAHDKDVLDRMSGWGWQDGLRPHPDAPVWRMDTFRNRFLTTYGRRPRRKRGLRGTDRREPRQPPMARVSCWTLFQLLSPEPPWVLLLFGEAMAMSGLPLLFAGPLIVTLKFPLSTGPLAQSRVCGVQRARMSVGAAASAGAVPHSSRVPAPAVMRAYRTARVIADLSILTPPVGGISTHCPPDPAAGPLGAPG